MSGGIQKTELGSTYLRAKRFLMPANIIRVVVGVVVVFLFVVVAADVLLAVLMSLIFRLLPITAWLAGLLLSQISMGQCGLG